MTNQTPTIGHRGPTDLTGPDRSGRRNRTAALAALGMAVLALAACGGASSASTTTAPKSAPPTGGATPPRTFPGASGTIAAINGSSLEVQNPATGQTTVSYTASTTFRQTTTTSATAVTVGSCVSAFGKPTTASSSVRPFGEPITATTVSVSQPVSGACTGGFGGRTGGGTGGTGGFAAGHTGSGTNSTPGGPNFRPPSGGRRFGNGQFGVASGMVTAVNGSAVSVDEVNPRTKQSSSVVVTLTASTTFTTTGAASPADLAVGKCARAAGTADTTGAITAQNITLSTPTNGSCTTTGFGFRSAGATTGA